MADFIRSSGPDNVDKEWPSISRASKLKGLNGLRSNPTSGISPPATTHGPTSSIDTVKSQSKASTKAPDPRSPGAIAREPITKDNSVRDFADFIRSTGPDVPAKPAPRPLGSALSKPLPPSNVSSSYAVETGKPLPNKIPGSIPTASKWGPPLPKTNREATKRTTSRLQPREPTVTNSNATADLAEFLRAGPIGVQVIGDQQTQTPSGAQYAARSNGVANGRIREGVNSGSSVASTQGSFAPSKLTQSSANSRTGLLNSQRQTHNDDSLGPVRTQRRNKDPYAIDSDDEEVNGYGTPQPPEREEESLSDFLRNYTPPPSAANGRVAPVALSGAPKATKQSGPTIRERIVRNIAVIPDYRPLPPKAPKKSSAPKSPAQSNQSRGSGQRKTSATSFQPQSQNNIARGRSTNNPAPQLPLIKPRETSPHLVSQNGTKLDTYKPTQPTYAKHVERRPKQHLQAREEQGSVGGMGDLADFLRETEPPPLSGPNGGMRPMSPSKEREESSFGRMFSRKKREIR